MLIRSPTFLVNIQSHFGSYNIDERMRMDPVLSALAFHCASEVDWFLSGILDEFLAYDFGTCGGTVE